MGKSVYLPHREKNTKLKRKGSSQRRLVNHKMRRGKKAYPVLFASAQGVTKRCRLSWLTNSSLVHEPKCGGRGRVAGSQPMSTRFWGLTPYLTYMSQRYYLIPEQDKDENSTLNGYTQNYSQSLDVQLINELKWYLSFIYIPLAIF